MEPTSVSCCLQVSQAWSRVTRRGGAFLKRTRLARTGGCCRRTPSRTYCPRPHRPAPPSKCHRCSGQCEPGTSRSSLGGVPTPQGDPAQLCPAATWLSWSLQPSRGQRQTPHLPAALPFSFFSKHGEKDVSHYPSPTPALISVLQVRKVRLNYGVVMTDGWNRNQARQFRSR